MRRPAMNFKWLNHCLVLFFFLTASVFAVAQDATPPPPPPDAPPTSVQQPAPEANVRAVRLSDVQGTVQVFNGTEVAFSQAQLNMPVVEGMKLVTAEDGRAEIQFEDGSVARVTPNSSVTLTQLSRNSDGSSATVIEADTGLTYYELNGRAGQYTVRFGHDNIVPVDSSIFRIDLDNSPAELAVTHGSVHVSDNQDLAADVHTNQTVRFDAQNPDEYQLLQSVSANTWDQWNSDRDQALAELDDTATAARASTGNPDNPAWSDLDANGDWYNVPGYGNAWAPSGVGQDWDPYGVGSWGYYNDIGYTWISGYSWGWWPYHCGAWSWFDGFGWMWFPGNCGWGGIGIGGGWYPYGTIWRVPPGYKCPRRPVPVHYPGHGSIPHEPLIAVNRGPQFTQQFRSVAGGKSVPRMFQYDGQNIAPVAATIHSHQGGPLGEGFTSTVQRTNPEVFVRRAYGGTGYRPPSGAGTPAYQPSRVYTPPSRPAPSGGGHVSAPAPAFHASSPASAPAASSHPR
ncbi:MAG: DUF6600 domain-containing protein [Silvibacterium sp.]